MKQHNNLWEKVLPLMYVAWMVIYPGEMTAFELTPDEGVNLVKALLMTQGHALYSAIWSDQPPVLTCLLRVVVELFGVGIAAPRTFMLAMTGFFLWGIGRFVRTTYGQPHAVLTQTFVLTQPEFLALSPAVLIGLPAIYLAFLALAMLSKGLESGSRFWIGLSASMLALSAMTKLFTLVVVPVVFILLIARAVMKSDRLHIMAVWLIPFSAVLGFILLVFVGPENVHQLLDVHIKARDGVMGPAFDGLTLGSHLAKLPWLILLAALGGVIAALKRDGFGMLLLGWLVAACVSLHFHAPVWPHQQFLVTLPAAVLSGLGAGAMLARYLPGFPAPLLAALCVAASATGMMRSGLPTVNDDGSWRETLESVRHHAEENPSIVSDRPMFVYRAGLITPPWLGAITHKRISADALTERDIEAAILEDRPHQVLLGRFELPGLRARLAEDYRIVSTNRAATLYVRRMEAGEVDTVDPTWRSWVDILQRPADWCHSSDAKHLADMILRAQGPHGGWSKHFAPVISTNVAARATQEGEETFDNGATVSQLRYLMKMRDEGGMTNVTAAIQRGVEFMLRSQYASGGWPQIYPPPQTYEAYATLNDDAMVEILRLLRVVGPFPGTNDDRDAANRITLATERALDFLMRTQVIVDGRKTVWCQQYDPVTLEPRPARPFEPAALASRESVGVVQYLMSLEQQSEEVKEAVHAACAWFAEAEITGIRLQESPDDNLPHGRNRTEVSDPAAPPVWARFYDLRDGRPLFAGRDGIIKQRYNDIEAERRAGYDYYTRKPSTLLSWDYPRWRMRTQEPLPHVDTSGN